MRFCNYCNQFADEGIHECEYRKVPMEKEHTMDGKTYIETQMRVIEMGKIADSLDLEAFLKCISNAEAMAPVIDPTMYRKAIANLTAIRDLARIALKMKIAYGEVFKAVLETAVAGYMENKQREEK